MTTEPLKQLGLKVPEPIAVQYDKLRQRTGLPGPEILAWGMRLIEQDPKLALLEQSRREYEQVLKAVGIDPFNLSENKKRSRRRKKKTVGKSTPTHDPSPQG